MGRKAVIDRIEIDPRSGVISVRMLKLSSDGDELGYHRTVIEPGVPVADQMSLVGAHLDSMGFAAPALDELAVLEEVAGMVQTTEKVSAFQEAKLAASASEA